MSDISLLLWALLASLGLGGTGLWLLLPRKPSYQEIEGAPPIGPSRSPSTAPAVSAVGSTAPNGEGRGTPPSVTVQWHSGRWQWEIVICWASGSSSRILVDGSLPLIRELRVIGVGKRKGVWHRIR